jgi:hypothetical protein
VPLVWSILRPLKYGNTPREKNLPEKQEMFVALLNLYLVTLHLCSTFEILLL